MYYINENIKKLNRIGGEQGRADFLRLDMNENPEGLPKDFVDSVLKKITPEFLATYPEPEKLTREIADFHKLEMQNVCLVNGSDEAIKMIYQAFTREGDNVVTVSPSFAMYDIYATMFGLEHRMAEYHEDFTIAVSDIRKQIDKNTDIVVLLNPNNPIGNAFSEDEVLSIIELAERNNAIVVIDEAYHYFYEGDFIHYMKKYSNVIVLRTFSKLFSLAGCRLGYALANQQIIQYINNIKPTFHVNSIALLFGEALLNNPVLISNLIKIQKEGKEYLCTELKNKKYFIFEGKGNFIFIKPQKEVDRMEAYLRENKILIKTYHTGFLKDYIRVTTGSTEVMKQFLKVFEEAEGLA